MTIAEAQIYWNNTNTPVSEHFDDVYYSNLNGLAESRYVFIDQNHLIERWKNFSYDTFVIAETGFGTGLNFLATCQTFIQFIKESASPIKLEPICTQEPFWFSKTRALPLCGPPTTSPTTSILPSGDKLTFSPV